MQTGLLILEEVPLKETIYSAGLWNNSEVLASGLRIRNGVCAHTPEKLAPGYGRNLAKVALNPRGALA